MKQLSASFLRIKHWQLFLLLVVPDFSDLFYSANSFIDHFATVLGFSLIVAWIYSAGTELVNKLPEGHGVKKLFFQINCIYVVAFMTIETFFFNGGFTMVTDYPKFWWISLPAEFYFSFCLFYSAYFAARMLSSAIKGRIVGFHFAIGYFFAFAFFPVGVWIIQPKLNRLSSALPQPC